MGIGSKLHQGHMQWIEAGPSCSRMRLPFHGRPLKRCLSSAPVPRQTCFCDTIQQRAELELLESCCSQENYRHYAALLCCSALRYRQGHRSQGHRSQEHRI